MLPFEFDAGEVGDCNVGDDADELLNQNLWELIANISITSSGANTT